MADIKIESPQPCFSCGKTFPDLCQCRFENIIKSGCDCKAVRQQLAEAKKDYNELLEIFGHYHKANVEKGNDSCGICGLDLRNPIHTRL